MAIKLSELKAMEEVVTTAPETLTARQVAGQALINIPESGMQYGKDILTALTDPIGTAKTIGELGLGIIQLAIPGEQANEKQAKAVGQYFANRYGGLENIKQTIATDPVGFLGDASVLLTGTGSIAGKVGGLKEVAETTKKAGQFIDPLTLPTKAAGTATKSVLGLTTGVGPEAIRTAVVAGATGGQQATDFSRAMRSKDDPRQIVEEARKGIKTMAEKRKAEYKKGIEKAKASKKEIDFTPVLKSIDNIRKSFEFKGKTTLDAGGLRKLKEIENAVLDWSVDRKFHTVEGLDALKKKIDNLMPEADTFGKTSGKGAAVVTQARTTINNLIKKASPEYAKTMKAYEEAISLEKEMKKALSLGDKATADTALRKLLSVMRTNVNTNFGIRLQLLKQLEKAGDVSLTPKIAGETLSGFIPTGLARQISPIGAVGIGGFYGATAPQMAGLLAATSPRLVGEAAFKVGQAQRFLPPSAVTRQAGVIEQQIGGDENLSMAALRKAFNIGRQPQ